MSATVRFRLSRNALVAPGWDGRAGEVVDVDPVVAAELFTVAAGELVDPARDRAAVSQAVRRWWAAQPRLERPR
ncbi:MAG: hypothetical protein WCJ87_13610 [Burkholderiales bacterium]